MKQQLEQTRDTLRIIRYPELFNKVPLSRSQIWRLEREGKFPKSIKIGANSKGWVESQIDDWLCQRIEEAA